MSDSEEHLVNVEGRKPTCEEWMNEAIRLAEEIEKSKLDFAELQAQLKSAKETARVEHAWAEDYKEQRDELRLMADGYEHAMKVAMDEAERLREDAGNERA